MALGLSPEYLWNQIISKSARRFSRRSRLKLFSIYSPGGNFVQQSIFFRQSHKEHSCIIISKSIHWLRRSHLKVFLFLALAAILFDGAPSCLMAQKFEQF